MVQEATRGTTPGVALQTMPGVGPITAMAIETFAPPMAVFRPWPRLCRLARACSPATFDGRQAASRQDLEDGLKRDIRRLLIIGAMAVVRLASRKAGPEELAASPAGAQATDVVGHRTRQQNGARDLGHADEGRRLSGSCRCNALIHDRTVQPRKRWARGEVDER